MKTTGVAAWVSAGVVVTCIVVAGTLRVRAEEATGGTTGLTAAAAAALQKTFPGSVVKKVESETENGVNLFSATLEQDGQKLDVEVSPDGVIGEAEYAVPMERLPKALAAAIADATKGGRLLRIEKHEIRGLAKDGKLVLLPALQTRFEVKYTMDGKRASLVATEAADGTVNVTKPAASREDDNEDDETED